MPIEHFNLTPEYAISRVIKGGWHLAGGHGKIDQADAISDMTRFVEAGITTFDCADIYTGVEALIGKFLRKHRDAFNNGNLPEVQVHTKYVPDYDALAQLRKEDTVRVIDRSLSRLGVERLDLVQFAWWDYQFPRYIEAAGHLKDLQQEGKIRYLGITNFDTDHILQLKEAGISLTSNQVQYSVMDQRAAKDQPEVYGALNIPFLCYGAVAGGFLSDRYLGQPDPSQPLENRSLTKYRLIIEEFGSWAAFQELLGVLHRIALKYDVGIAEVACRYVLDQPHVGAVIVGARNRRHLDALQKLTEFDLDDEDCKKLSTVISKGKGPSGPFYALERDKKGKHGSIMKYNLNKE